MTTKREITKHGNSRWEVDYGLDTAGKKVRRLFKSEADADDAIELHQKELKKAGSWWVLLNPAQRQEIQFVVTEIKKAGFSLNQVWTDHQRWRKENGQTAIESWPFDEAVEEWSRRKLASGKSQRYVAEVSGVFMKFGKGREKQPIHEIKPAELEDWFKQQTTWRLSSKQTQQSRFSSLWSVAVAKGWCSYNIVDRLEPIKRATPEVKIYENATIIQLLAAILEKTPTQKVLAPILLEAFGCMRPEEVSTPPEDPKIKPFSWDDIDLKNGRITVRPGVAKTGDQRTIRLQPMALELLKPAKALDCPLPPVNERRLTDQCCETIGLADWIRDGLRKCCATHLRAVYKNDYDVVRDMGNSVRVLLKHYADLQTPEKISLEYWRITPRKVKSYMRTEAWPKLLRKRKITFQDDAQGKTST